MNLNEELIKSWIRLTAIMKNSRLLKQYNYNEAILLNLIYDAYIKKEGIYLKDILSFTNMLKSLANRTINQLVEKGFVYRKKDSSSNRQILFFNPDKEEEYLKMHSFILKMVEEIKEVLGEEDSLEFIRIVKKISDHSELE